MNFDFSDELKQLRSEAKRFLADSDTRSLVRSALDGKPDDRSLWKSMAGLGWMSSTIPEAYGGSGMGHLAACVLAEQIGYSVSPAPFSSSVYLATEAILAFGSDAQKSRWLPRLASGEAIGTIALVGAAGPITPEQARIAVSSGRMTGTRTAVPDGMVADFAVILAADAHNHMLHLVDLTCPEVTRTPLPTLDQSRPQARLVLDACPAEALEGARDWNAVRSLLDRAAVMLSFEQIGGAQAALEMARDYALDRYAFGRPIASFQAIKHKLADVYMVIELARSSAYYGAWALDKNAPQLTVAASSARVAACEAAWIACKENIQTHGGMGYTWDLDCHLYYRRAKAQALVLGSSREWKRRLMDEVSPKTAVQSESGEA